MHPEAISSLVAMLAAEQLAALDAARLARVAPPREEGRRGIIAVIPVAGVLMPRSYRVGMHAYAGLDTLRERLAAAAGNREIAAIVLDVDSPGGAVAGTVETAQAVAEAARRKPVVAVANTLAASAAYWIASQAGSVVMAPHAETGSIGVLAMHQNTARMMERIGISTTLIRSGPRKAEGHPFGPLDETARRAIQARVDEAASSLFAAVARGRGMTAQTVRERFGDGRVLGAKEAVAAGLADKVATLDQVVAELAAGRTPQSRARAFGAPPAIAARQWPRRSGAAFL